MDGPRNPSGARPAGQRGLTLIELMVTVAVWSLLLAGLVSFVVNTNHGYRLQRALNGLNDSGRYALSLLLREMRMANHWGLSLTASDAALVGTPPAISLSQDCTVANTGAVSGALQGLAVLPPGDLSGGLCAGLSYGAAQGHVLLVRYADPSRTSDAAVAALAPTIPPFVRARLSEQAELFQGDPATLYATGPLSAGTSPDGASNYRYRQAYYLVGADSASAPTELKSITLEDRTMSAGFLVEGAERLQFTLLVDEQAPGGNAGDQQWMTPSQVSALSVGEDPWLQVQGAYVELLVRTNVRDLGLPTADADNTYSFLEPGATGNKYDYVVPSDDRTYHRRLLSASVQFRNNRPSR